MKKTPLSPLLILVLASHGIHYREPDAIPPEEHIEIDYPDTPIPGGRPTAWLTSTNTSSTVSDVISLPWARR